MRRRILSVFLIIIALLSSALMTSCAAYDFVFNSLLHKNPYAYIRPIPDYGFSSITICEFNNHKYISAQYNRCFMNFNLSNTRPSVFVALTRNQYGMLSRTSACKEDKELLLLYSGRDKRYDEYYYDEFFCYRIDLYNEQFDEQILTIQNEEIGIQITLNDLISESIDKEPIKIKEGALKWLGINRLKCSFKIKGCKDFISVAVIPEDSSSLYHKDDKFYLGKINAETIAYELFEINQEYNYLFDKFKE